VWGVGKETSFICGGENFFIGTDLIKRCTQVGRHNYL